MRVDLRSDTVTKPSKEMLQFMMQAETGDDVFGEDPSINLLEQRIKDLFGTQAALFVPTATMANQIAIKLLTKPLDEVICDRTAHVYVYEVGGIAFHSGCSIRYIQGERGVFTAEDVLKNINPEDVHKPISSLVCLENTSNRGGGRIYPIETIREIYAVCIERGLKLHLDGSRIFNAIVASEQDPKEFGKLFDTITICLSKGLGCAAGAVLTGTAEAMRDARRIRKSFGGGMRQAGILAAGGMYALDHHVKRLSEDHDHAKTIAHALNGLKYVEEILQVETNIIIFRLNRNIKDDDFIRYLASMDIHAFAIGENYVRFVLHLNISDEMVQQTCESLKSFTHV